MVRLMGKRNVAKLERSKVEKSNDTNASFLCENNKNILGMALRAVGCFFVGLCGGRGGGSGAILHNIVIGQ